MKNIHILQTEKPSRLFKDDFGKYFVSINIDQEQNHFKPQNIYITNDSKIKEGDWCIATEGIWKNKIVKITGEPITDIWKKIILTDNPDLIKNGVQAIDDEFLEWFVKNPSCESVEVVNKYYYNGSNNEIPSHISLDNLGSWGYGKYKIIIPQEEPKQEKLEEKLDKIVSKEHSKFWKESDERFRLKGTPEEATEIILANNIDGLRDALKDDDLFYFYKGVIQCYGEAMANWQQERMYSEEDMKKAFHVGKLNQGREGDTSFEKFIEQFKNK